MAPRREEPERPRRLVVRPDELRRSTRQAVSFAVIGVVNTLVHLLIYQGLVTLAVPYLPASAIGYTAGLVNSFVLNRRFTFRGEAARRWHGQFLRFAIVNLAALGVNLWILDVVVSAGWLGPRLAVAPAILGSLTCNFLGNKLWTFRRRSGPEVEPDHDRTR